MRKSDQESWFSVSGDYAFPPSTYQAPSKPMFCIDLSVDTGNLVRFEVILIENPIMERQNIVVSINRNASRCRTEMA
jgi:hypothetical protein